MIAAKKLLDGWHTCMDRSVVTTRFRLARANKGSWVLVNMEATWLAQRSYNSHESHAEHLHRDIAGENTAHL